MGTPVQKSNNLHSVFVGNMDTVCPLTATATVRPKTLRSLTSIRRRSVVHKNGTVYR